MAKKIYTGVSGIVRNVKTPYFGVDGVARKVKKGYIGVDGVAREFFSGGVTPIGELEVGASVFIEVNGVIQEYLVIQQGKPNSDLYDDTADGTWLLKRYYGDDTNDYVSDKQIWNNVTDSTLSFGSSSAYSSLNTESSCVLSNFNSEVQSAIKSVNLPCNIATSKMTTCSAKLFLLSVTELIGGTTTGTGSHLAYFKEDETGEALNYYSYQSIGTSSLEYWTRDLESNALAYYYTNRSDITSRHIFNASYFRYAFILSSETPVNEDGTLAL